jgi:hypothetical protein
MGSRTGLGGVERRKKNLDPTWSRNATPRPYSLQPVAISIALSCPKMGFGITGIEPWGSTIKELLNRYELAAP